MVGDPYCNACGRSTCTSLVWTGTDCKAEPKSAMFKIGPGMAEHYGNMRKGMHMSRAEMESCLAGYMGDEFFAKRFMDCVDLLKAKNSDYTEGEGQRDRIKHFREAAKKHEIPIKKIWGIFVDKHWSAVQKYLKSGQTESEPIDGRINDVINYLVLLTAIIDDESR